MNTPKIMEHNGTRILTTAQLAVSYGTDNRRISENFNSNKHRYKEGKHFFLLEGQDLKDFGKQYANSVSVERVSKLYLWTEKGAWLHAKSLNTDEAWDAYEMLVDEYYNIKDQLPSPPQSLELALQAALEHEREIKNIKSDVDYLKGNMRVDSLQQQEIQQEAKSSIIQALGGSDSLAYQQISRKVFSTFWNEFKKYFKVPRYGDIPKSKHEEAIRFIKLWRPATSMQMEIDSCNSQMRFD
ncbi:ORF6N domain-containing protein [Cytobacillus firmus]|uniref:ORF6N domain-containing protein n=2 Tax=Cytobacillus TaxID=2675230 RepID=A0A366JPK3_CYTFI|nr:MULTISPECIES: ORF6C domain-containing protein [Cytobacillus]RBP89358.1 ORF6N domain-containing protein [Cytobacillus firmus]TDX47415.1 ORF6N domain-containing protein [Cytobacillus oceanisediminis]